MSKRYFLFENGKISEHVHIEEKEEERLYLNKVPMNFLELVDELKKFSFVCHAVYVVLSDVEMNIFLFKRDSLESFTKHHAYLVKEETSLPIHERLKDFLFSFSEE